MALIGMPYGVSVALLCATGAAVAALTNPKQHKYFPLPGRSILPFDRELPGQNLADGTPTKLYSLALGQAWHDHTADAALSVAVEEKKLARRIWQGRGRFICLSRTASSPLSGVGNQLCLRLRRHPAAEGVCEH